MGPVFTLCNMAELRAFLSQRAGLKGKKLDVALEMADEAMAETIEDLVSKVWTLLCGCAPEL